MGPVQHARAQVAWLRCLSYAFRAGVRLDNIQAHHVAGDPLSAGWAQTPMRYYPMSAKEPHGIKNFIN